jgi:hypothetical protein
MSSIAQSNTTLVVIAIALLASSVFCHMQMDQPAPRGNKLNTGYTPVDYDLTSPLGGSKSFPVRFF